VRIWGVEQQAEFADFYRSARDGCLRVVLINVGDRQLAEDLVAEAFTRAWVSWRQVRQHPAPRAWVVRTALNAHVSSWRRRRHEVALGEHDIAVPVGDDPVMSSALMTSLRRLPLRQREVVTLRFLLDLDTRSTARVLGIAEGTVCVHLHRALAALRDATAHPYRQEIDR
jgi:RNA polymerase sigma factor (sigma-70 family)